MSTDMTDQESSDVGRGAALSRLVFSQLRGGTFNLDDATSLDSFGSLYGKTVAVLPFAAGAAGAGLVAAAAGVLGGVERDDL